MILGGNSMHEKNFEYYRDQYCLAIVNDGDWYKALRAIVQDLDDFKPFCQKIQSLIEVLQSRHKLCIPSAKDKVYIRFWVLRYLFETNYIRSKFGNDDIFCEHISYCHSNDMSWLAEVVTGIKPDHQSETQSTKEETMSTIEIKTITYINDADVSKLTEEALIQWIKSIELEIDNLQAVKTKSTKIQAKITGLQETLAKVVEILDAR
jgi:hypothetical protein